MSGFSHSLSFMLLRCGLRHKNSHLSGYRCDGATPQPFPSHCYCGIAGANILDYRSQGISLARVRIMPDHFHALITPLLMFRWKKRCSLSRVDFIRLRSKHDVWMRSFNESQIATEEKFMSCVGISKRTQCGGLAQRRKIIASVRLCADGWMPCLCICEGIRPGLKPSLKLLFSEPEGSAPPLRKKRPSRRNMIRPR